MESHLMVIMFEVTFGPLNYTKNMAVLFDDRDLTEEQVQQIVESGDYYGRDDLVVMPAEAYYKIFRSIFQEADKEESK